MGPEIHYQFVVGRAAELQREAADQRRVREAASARKASQRSGERRQRGAFGKLRTS
ncbi:hypothetical protein JOL79_22005 [Microbispora sp. RL4-1S]|uniref:Uncharacterized protein n=1 Tax=Microbispora oryzae TaxID=2806554 RepID=A0A940WJ58_9ACTN|nr:hypothetical protein [Microbispora oryzae]MBP2706486.1 hypothetical protein [Microbispora oryzae]